MVFRINLFGLFCSFVCSFALLFVSFTVPLYFFFFLKKPFLLFLNIINSGHYNEFHVAAVPYPGVEWFKNFREKKYQAEEIVG